LSVFDKLTDENRVEMYKSRLQLKSTLIKGGKTPLQAEAFLNYIVKPFNLKRPIEEQFDYYGCGY